MRRIGVKEVGLGEIRAELSKLGVAALSGEGCKMGTRVVTDVRPDVAQYIEEYMGGMKLTHPGMNGWTIDPDGNWHEGRCTWDYEKKCKKEGWTTQDGFCFQMPYVLETDLFIFLTLKLAAEMVILVNAHGPLLSSFILIFEDLDEGKKFRDELNQESWRLYHEKEDGRTPDADYSTLAKMLAAWNFQTRANYRVWTKEDAGENTHAWSGRTIA